MDALRAVSQRYDAKDFDTNLLQDHIEHDIETFERLSGNWLTPITPRKTPNSKRSRARLTDEAVKGCGNG